MPSVSCERWLAKVGDRTIPNYRHETNGKIMVAATTGTFKAFVRFTESLPRRQRELVHTLFATY
jgi:hypothetical protein